MPKNLTSETIDQILTAAITTLSYGQLYPISRFEAVNLVKNGILEFRDLIDRIGEILSTDGFGNRVINYAYHKRIVEWQKQGKKVSRHEKLVPRLGYGAAGNGHFYFNPKDYSDNPDESYSSRAGGNN